MTKMEFVTDKGSVIPLVDLPHNVVYNESGSYPQHRRRKMEDGDGDLLLTINDADWICLLYTSDAADD